MDEAQKAKKCVAKIKAQAVDARETGNPRMARILNELADIGQEFVDAGNKKKPK